jgi:ribonuclease HI
VGKEGRNSAVWERATRILKEEKPGVHVLQYLRVWEDLGARTWAENGLMPNWIDEEKAKELCRQNLPTQKQRKMFLSSDLEEELWKSCVKDEEANILTRVDEKDVKWATPAWVIPKRSENSKETTYRRVLDCRSINSLLTDIPFHMEDTRTILDLARPNLFATSLDFKSAYNLFPIQGDTEAKGLKDPENFAYFHCFQVKNTWWKPRGMLFGAKHAPYYFTMIMKPIIKTIRTRWKTDVVIYLDDMLILHEDPSYLCQATNEIADFLLSLGIILSVEKCEPIPKRIIKFLGWEWNFENFTLRMTQERKKTLYLETKNLLRKMNKGVWTTIKNLQELVGKLQFLKPQLNRILLYLRPLYDMIAEGIAKGGQRGGIYLRRNASGSLKWILKEIEFNTPRDLRKHPPEGTLTTDASEDGYGATLLIEEEEFYMCERFDEANPPPESSNQRELLAVLRAIRHFQAILKEKKICALTLESDNTTTVYNILKVKAAKGPLPIVRELFSTLTELNITLIPLHRPGKLNGKADALSRLEWMGDYEVKWEVVQKVLNEWGIQPSIDLFATSKNHKLPLYCSAEKNDGGAVWVDAWTQPWKEWKYPYIHTTPALIARCLQRIQQEEIAAIILAPMWPSQPWWDLLKRMTRVAQPLGLGEDILVEGAEMKRRQTKLPPGWMELALVVPSGYMEPKRGEH